MRYSSAAWNLARLHCSCCRLGQASSPRAGQGLVRQLSGLEAGSSTELWQRASDAGEISATSALASRKLSRESATGSGTGEAGSSAMLGHTPVSAGPLLDQQPNRQGRHVV